MSVIWFNPHWLKGPQKECRLREIVFFSMCSLLVHRLKMKNCRILVEKYSRAQKWIIQQPHFIRQSPHVYHNNSTGLWSVFLMTGSHFCHSIHFSITTNCFSKGHHLSNKGIHVLDIIPPIFLRCPFCIAPSTSIVICHLCILYQTII